MQQYSEFYSAIDDIAEHLRTDFIGPIEDDEILEMERPLNRYSLGILWAQPKSKNSEQSDLYDSLEEMFEDESEDNEKLKNINIFKPSSMGISFAAFSNDRLDIDFTYALYHYSEKVITDNGNEVKRQYYTREAKKFQTSIIVPDKMHKTIIRDEENSDIQLHLHVRKINEDHSELITISVLNKHKAGTEFLENNTNALFQCMLSIKNNSGFIPVYRRNTHKSFEEEKFEKG